MSEPQFSITRLPQSQRVLFTAALLLFGFGYLFALINIAVTFAGRAGGNPAMVSYEDIVAGYSGSDKASALESALNGPMREMLPQDERAAIISWARNGALPDAFARDIGPIIANRCMACHDGKDAGTANLSSYTGVKNLASANSGPTSAALVRDSHIHLFGLGFIFFIVGFMFSYTDVRPWGLKLAVTILPFIAAPAEIVSWFLVRLYHPMAWVVIGCGAVMASCFAFMWLVTMYQLWFYMPGRKAA